jgi:hypothetical protein
MNLGLTRRNIGRLVLLTWAVMLAWLARREFAKGGSAGVAERTRQLEPGAQYFAVLAAGRQVGLANLSVDTVPEGVRLREQLVFDLPFGDSTRQLARGAEYLISRALRLRHYTRTEFGIGPPERLDAALGADSILELSGTEGSDVKTGRVRLRVDPEAILPAMLPYRAAFGRHLRVGEVFTLPLIEIATGTTRRLEVRVAAESTFIVPDSAVWDSAGGKWVTATSDTIQAWRLDHDATGIPTRSWVDAGGALLRQESAGGVTLQSSAFELVLNNYRRARRSESSAWRRAIPGMIGLAARKRRPDTAASYRDFLILADSSTGLSGMSRALQGGRQTLRHDTLRVWRDTPSETAPDDPRMALGPAWDLPVLDDAMHDVATQVLARAKTGADSARTLTLWVARQVVTDTESTASGTAISTLRIHHGSPDAKARLLVTLARTKLIPARVVTGLAVLPQGVFSHTWAELWLGRWIAADPTYGDFPASAALVRIAVGGRSRPVDLLPLVGSARFLPLRVPR